MRIIQTKWTVKLPNERVADMGAAVTATSFSAVAVAGRVNFQTLLLERLLLI